MAFRRLLFLILIGLSVSGCATWQIRKDVQRLPVTHSMKFDQLVVYSNTPLPARHRLLDELNTQRERQSTASSVCPPRTK